MRATRDVHTPTGVSKRAIPLPHRRYAKSPWTEKRTEKTPCWC
ncbi:MAG TPA: hypothetical protein VD995_25470 [Azospirillum sp.]|nr:hypothetical protein [Azospirillum sp.]